MKASLLLILAISVLLFGSLAAPSASAQFQSGGVDKEGTWYAGEGLRQGDFFSYSMCHVDYKECTNFELDMWIKGDKKVGTETKWLADVAVFDGNKIIVGEIEFGKIAPEPTGGSSELGLYRGAFKSSIVWLSAFATSDDSSGGKGPKKFSDKSWGKIGNIGGEQVVPMKLETVVTPAGTWDTVQVGWKTGGVTSKVWIVDDFPFPVKAKTYTHVSEGIPPTEYEFTLLDYKQNVQVSPIDQYKSTSTDVAQAGCETNIEKSISIKKPTNNFDYQIHINYGPEDLVQGCESQWLIKFISKYDDTEFLNQVQYDFLVVDDNLTPLRSIAQEEGQSFLYSPSGQAILDFIVKEEPGTAKYVVWVYGLAPQGIVPSVASDYLKFSVPIFAKDGTAPVQKIPSWIKNNAGWWADGSIDDKSFVEGIKFLIKEGIMKIPPTTQGSGGSTSAIPDWIKNNAGWWADGLIDDDSFVQGIQFLIKEGIMKIPTSKSTTSSGSEPPAWYD
ncbi:peptidase [Nitrosopumilus oxyclinae]|uniref:Peptidase n=1 Tax=Nitrosopumilus oxyclinae TaxID=1959104 RepID=A0A7D5RFA0_9ARCH|nr:peptidase [Nitrosopumilus oxyclinae]QLH05525.1 peptidase [Nitrosopumilus oxyclinae]